MLLLKSRALLKILKRKSSLCNENVCYRRSIKYMSAKRLYYNAEANTERKYKRNEAHIKPRVVCKFSYQIIILSNNAALLM